MRGEREGGRGKKEGGREGGRREGGGKGGREGGKRIWISREGVTLAMIPAMSVRRGNITDTTKAIFQLKMKPITKPAMNVVK